MLNVNFDEIEKKCNAIVSVTNKNKYDVSFSKVTQVRDRIIDLEISVKGLIARLKSVYK